MTIKLNDGITALDVAKNKNQKKIYRMIYETLIESMSSKEKAKKCVNKNDCQNEIKTLLFEKIDETFPSSKTCVICFGDRNGIFAFIPCGHAKTCQKCCTKIIEELRKCPLCRCNVSKYQKIFD